MPRKKQTITLTSEDVERFRRLERQLLDNLEDVGKAWYRAVSFYYFRREWRLFKCYKSAEGVEYRTLEAYAKKACNIHAETMRRLVDWVRLEIARAAKRGEQNPARGWESEPPPVPTIQNERHARELAPLLAAPELIAPAYAAAEAAAKNEQKPLNHNHVAEAVSELLAAAERQKLALNGSLVAPQEADRKRLPFSDWFYTADTGDGLPMVADGSIDVVITSPPYNVGHTYGNGFNDDLPHADYLARLRRWCAVIVSKVKTAGRICFNVADIGTARDPNRRHLIRPMDFELMNIMESLGCVLYQRIIWDRGGVSCRMRNFRGSHLSPASPMGLRRHEHIIVFSKGEHKRSGLTQADSLCSSGREWQQLIQSVWQFQPAVNRGKDNHPCRFPIKLPLNCLKLFGAKGDVVLDPFAGTGTTARAAYQLGLRCICVEQNPEHCEHGRRQLVAFAAKMKRQDSNATIKFPRAIDSEGEDIKPQRLAAVG